MYIRLGGLLPQDLVRPLNVVSVPEAVEGLPLSLPAGLWRRRGLPLEGPMESLEASVLFGVSGFDAFGNYPQLDPPCGEWREVAQSDAGEGRAVVGADDQREAVLSEGSLQDALDFRTGGRSRVSHTSKYRDIASWAVRGSMRLPSPVRNHLFKSMGHTSFSCTRLCHRERPSAMRTLLRTL